MDVKPRTLTEQIMVRMTPAEHEALVAEAERSERTVAQLVRLACKSYLAGHRALPEGAEGDD